MAVQNSIELQKQEIGFWSTFKLDMTSNDSVTWHSQAPYGLFLGYSRTVLNKNPTSTHGARTGPVRRCMNFASPYRAHRVLMHAL